MDRAYAIAIVAVLLAVWLMARRSGYSEHQWHNRYGRVATYRGVGFFSNGRMLVGGGAEIARDITDPNRIEVDMHECGGRATPMGLIRPQHLIADIVDVAQRSIPIIKNAEACMGGDVIGPVAYLYSGATEEYRLRVSRLMFHSVEIAYEGNGWLDSYDEYFRKWGGVSESDIVEMKRAFTATS